MRLSRDNWIVLGILAVVTVTYVLVIYRWQVRRLEGLREKLPVLHAYPPREKRHTVGDHRGGGEAT